MNLYLKNYYPLLWLLLATNTSQLFSCCNPKLEDISEADPIIRFTNKVINTPFPEVPVYNRLTCIKTIDDAAPELAQADTSTLVVFDIDETLLEPSEPSFQQRFLRRCPFFYRKPFARIINGVDFYFKQERHLIEPHTADIIKDLQKRAVPVIALSAFRSGPCGYIKDFHEYRYQELLRNGIDFEQNFSVDSSKLNNELELLSKDKLSHFKRGIISSSNYSKGIVLGLFISCMHHSPDKVIFIDDNQKNLFQVAEHLIPLKIPASNYLYTAAYTIRPSDSIDWAIAQRQADLINQKLDFVSYQEAAETL